MQMTLTIDLRWLAPFVAYWRSLWLVVKKEWLRFLIRTSLPDSPFKHEYEGALAKAKTTDHP